jgi:hypothetical protein
MINVGLRQRPVPRLHVDHVADGNRYGSREAIDRDAQLPPKIEDHGAQCCWRLPVHLTPSPGDETAAAQAGIGPA